MDTFDRDLEKEIKKQRKEEERKSNKRLHGILWIFAFMMACIGGN